MFGTPRKVGTPKPPPRTRSRAGTPLQQIHSKTQDVSSFLLRTDTITVSTIGVLPSKLVTVMQNYPGKRLSCVIDQSSGFVCYATPQSCFVWNYKKGLGHLNCTEFKMPLRLDLERNLLVSFVVAGRADTRQVGMMVCSQDGLLRFWENIEFDPNSYKETRLNLNQYQPSFIQTFEHFGVIIGLGPSLLKCVHTDGQLKITPLSSGSEGFLGFKLFSVSDGYPAICNGETPQQVVFGQYGDSQLSRFAYVLTDTRLQKWQLFKLGSEKLLQDWNLFSVLEKALKTAEFTVLRIDYEKSDTILLLVEYQVSPTLSGYKFVRLDEKGKDLIVLNTKNLKYTQDMTKEAVPSFVLSNGGPAALVMFPQAVIVTTTDVHQEFEEIIPLKDHDLLALGVDRSKLLSKEFETQSTVVMCTMDAEYGLLQLDVLIKPTKDFKEIHDRDRTSMAFETKLEQAVFFSAEKSNPLLFSLSNFQGDLDQPCARISDSIVNSFSQHLPKTVDFSSALREKTMFHANLVFMMNENGLMNQVSSGTRLHLLSNAEKLSVLQTMWQYLDPLLASVNADDTFKQSVNAYVATKGLQGLDAFFNAQLPDFEQFLRHVQTLTEKRLATGRKEPVLLSALVESSRIFSLVFKTATDFRSEHESKFLNVSGIPWTFTPVMLAMLQTQFELVCQEMADFGRYANFARSQAEAKSVYDALGSCLRDVCDFLLGAYFAILGQDTLDPRLQGPLNEMLSKFPALKERVVKALLEFVGIEDAFFVAEKYQDFETLVKLTLQVEDRDKRIDLYIHNYGKAFSKALYTHYMGRKEFQKLLVQGDRNDDLVDDFLKSSSLHHLSWIHDIKRHQFESASHALLQVATNEEKLQRQKLGFSLAKLAHIAAYPSSSEHDLERYQEEQQYIATQQAFVDVLLEGMDTSLQGYDQLAELLLKRHHHHLEKTMPATLGLLRTIYLRVCRGLNIKRTDLVLLATLLSPDAEHYKDLVGIAFEVVMDYKTTQEQKTQLFAAIYRRTWLSDSWKDIGAVFKRAGDKEKHETLSKTNTYTLYQLAFTKAEEGPSWFILSPEQIHALPNQQLLKKDHPTIPDGQFQMLQDELQWEDKQFESLGQLEIGAFYQMMTRDFASP
ncbi:Non-repetitive/WGA-negative nucleoporin C-terminal-domain-containing protein [Gorgonomyces haynaldii]|nr:Non-repetitive/WGA-negative nucleoporin C-terminal-domain-containing protein [Gorgonomyces haynaldii]